MSPFLLALRRIALQLSLPVGFALSLITLTIFFRRQRFAVVAFVVLWLASTPIASDALGHILENRFARIEARDCPKADAIVVLGGIVSVVQGNIKLNEAIDRFESGVCLLKLGKAPVLVFTGAELPYAYYNEGHALQQLAIEHGVPPASIRVIGSLYNTETEAAAVRKDLAQHNERHIILVTSAFHMPRAALLFHRAGIDLTPFPTDYRYTGSGWRLERWFPTPAALAQTDNTLHELYGYLLNRLK
jgi:uncharacterized SAM-binding protein YcdF (DUF218 family)